MSAKQGQVESTDPRPPKRGFVHLVLRKCSLWASYFYFNVRVFLYIILGGQLTQNVSLEPCSPHLYVLSVMYRYTAANQRTLSLLYCVCVEREISAFVKPGFFCLPFSDI